MIPQTLFSYFGEVYRYRFSAKLCTNYLSVHRYASKIGILSSGIVAILRHKLTYRHSCIASAVPWVTRVHSWHKIHAGPRFRYPSISSSTSTESQYFHNLSYTYFKPILGQLSPPEKKAVFVRTNGSLDVPWKIRMKRIIPCSIRLAVARRTRIGAYVQKYLRPFWERLYPSGKEMSFNRMNGSPGDPPGNRMHRRINQRVVPHITRLAGDPTGMEAGWETNIGDTKHVNQHIN